MGRELPSYIPTVGCQCTTKSLCDILLLLNRMFTVKIALLNTASVSEK